MILSLFGATLGFTCAKYVASLYFPLLIVAMFIVVWALDILLLARTARLVPVLPKKSLIAKE